jgi:transposase-like protein
MVIKIRGRKYWLWRAVDDEGVRLAEVTTPARAA